VSGIRTTKEFVPVRKSISIVVPAYNEEACIDELARRLTAVFERASDYDFDVIIVENGSTDRTLERLVAIRSRDERFRIVELARNFRPEGGVTAGLAHASGDAVILMCADLQDPPELILEFIEKWEQGYEHVYAVVTRRAGTSLIRRVNARAFYWIVGKLTGDLIPRDAALFRLADRRVYEAVNAMPERSRLLRGLFAWVGFRSIAVEHEREPRFGGQSNSNTSYAIDIAMTGIASYSKAPLHAVGLLGLLMTALGATSLVVVGAMWLFGGSPPPAGAIAAGVSIMFGVVVTCIGIVAEYVGLIFDEVRARPIFVVRR
jgi:dolichol-phosphate mannosyltransferase